MKKTIIAGLVAMPLIMSKGVQAKPLIDNSLEESNTIPRQELFLQTLTERAKKIQIEQEIEYRKAQQEKDRILRQSSVQFDPYDVTKLSYISTDELINVLNHVDGGTGLVPYASYFTEAERLYKINAIFLCSIAAQESGWGTKPAGDGTNLTGYAVYTSTSNGKTFEDGIRSNILETAKLIAHDYVQANSLYNLDEGYDGKSIWEINKNYCLHQDQETPKMSWSSSINKIGSNLNETFHELYI